MCPYGNSGMRRIYRKESKPSFSSARQLPVQAALCNAYPSTLLMYKNILAQKRKKIKMFLIIKVISGNIKVISEEYLNAFQTALPSRTLNLLKTCGAKVRPKKCNEASKVRPKKCNEATKVRPKKCNEAPKVRQEKCNETTKVRHKKCNLPPKKY